MDKLAPCAISVRLLHITRANDQLPKPSSLRPGAHAGDGTKIPSFSEKLIALAGCVGKGGSSRLHGIACLGQANLGY